MLGRPSSRDFYLGYVALVAMVIDRMGISKMELPLLSELRRQVESKEGCLEGWGCVYIQHILRSNVACAEFLEEMGLSKCDLRIIGKAYSTSQEALSEYIRKGFCARSIGDGYNYDQPFDMALVFQARREMQSLLESGISKLILIDEGGIGIQALAPLVLDFERVAVTELTARGAKHFHLLSEAAPIVDVARSVTKKTIEPPLIAASMVEHLMAAIEESENVGGKRPRFGLVGAGAIGSALIKILKERKFDVKWHDIDGNKIGGSDANELISWSDVILSSTGWGFEWDKLAVRASRVPLFANCGSSDVEFQLSRVASGDSLLGPVRFSVHDARSPWLGAAEIQHESFGKAVFLKGGFPINFDGSPDPIPAKKIQISRAILMAGAIQSVLSTDKGVKELDKEVQSRLAESYQRLDG